MKNKKVSKKEKYVEKDFLSKDEEIMTKEEEEKVKADLRTTLNLRGLSQYFAK